MVREPDHQPGGAEWTVLSPGKTAMPVGVLSGSAGAPSRDRSPSAPPPAVEGRTSGTVEPVDDHTCLLTLRGDDPHFMAVVVAFFGVGFEVLEPAEPKEHLRALGQRFVAQ